MKIIVAADKFKGSLSSLQACSAIKAGIVQADANAAVHLFPMADGGDGFAEVLKYYLPTETLYCKTVDPLMRDMDASYEWDAASKTAIIELASASGLLLLSDLERNPLKTSTLGTGVLIQHAVDKGAAKIILGLGGSATNDAGTGILSAMGFGFTDAGNNFLPPTGENLLRIKNIIPPPVIPRVQFTIACDVQNSLSGAAGAALMYAPQKGADKNAVAMLDAGLQHFANVVLSQTGKDISGFPGAGAAGGVAAGLSAFFDASVISGAAMVASVAGIENELSGAQLLIVGEGKIDIQSSQGKVVEHIAGLGTKYDIPVIAFCGEATITHQQMEEIGLNAVISLSNKSISKAAAIANASQLLTEAAAECIAYYQLKA